MLCILKLSKVNIYRIILIPIVLLKFKKSRHNIVQAAAKSYTNFILFFYFTDEVFHSEKIYELNENMACSVAGITSDANVLTNELRLMGQRYHYRYNFQILLLNTYP